MIGKILIILILSISIANAEELFPGEEWESNIIDLGNGGDDIFYLYYKCRNKTEQGKRLLIWFQGGPGCSGFLANMIENGPYLYHRSKELKRNPYAWNEVADLLYIDQPVGTGFSRMKNAQTECLKEKCVARNFYMFLLRFYDLHPEYKQKPLYLFGQSYGGQYIPAVAAYIVSANNPMINLKGCGIGNGEEDFSLQQGTHPIYGYQNKLLSYAEMTLQQANTLICQTSIATKTDTDHTLCFKAFEEMGNKVKNPSDITDPIGYPETADVVKFVNRPEAKAQFGVGNRSYEICNDTLYLRFIDDMFTYTLDDLNSVVSKGIHVMLYHGDKDAVCNWIGGEKVTDNIKWPYSDEFRAAQSVNMNINGTVYGRYRKARNLAFIQIHNAGHFSPFNQPMFALHLVKWMINEFK